MKTTKILFLSLATIAFGQTGWAKLNVVTTTPDLQAIVSEIGGDQADVTAIAKGTQDPHYIEAKPSYMTKVNRADLVVAVGLDLEIGWLPSILQGARNPKVMPGNKGYLEAGPLVQPIEVPSGKISRSEGDVHPLGNPHVTLDPIRTGEIAVKVAERMGELDSSHAAQFAEKAKALQSRLATKTRGWDERIKKSGVKKVVTYHKTLNYFFDRFGITAPAILEPKPGIPPTAGHTLEVIDLIKSQKVTLVMIENYFDPTISNRLKEAVPSLHVEVVPVSVDGAPGISKLDDLYERLVKYVEEGK